MSNPKAGQYGQCYKVIVLIVDYIRKNITETRKEIQKKLKNLVQDTEENDNDTDKYYGLTLVAKEELKEDWSVNPYILDGTHYLKDHGDKFYKSINALFDALYRDWHSTNSRIKKMLEDLHQQANDARTTNIPARDILSKLRSINETVKKIHDELLINSDMYEQKIKKMTEDFVADISTEYESMKGDDDRVVAKDSQRWWRDNFDDQINVNVDLECSFIEVALEDILEILLGTSSASSNGSTGTGFGSSGKGGETGKFSNLGYHGPDGLLEKLRDQINTMDMEISERDNLLAKIAKELEYRRINNITPHIFAPGHEFDAKKGLKSLLKAIKKNSNKQTKLMERDLE